VLRKEKRPKPEAGWAVLVNLVLKLFILSAGGDFVFFLFTIANASTKFFDGRAKLATQPRDTPTTKQHQDDQEDDQQLTGTKIHG
jgi:hypothetical protein